MNGPAPGNSPWAGHSNLMGAQQDFRRRITRRGSKFLYRSTQEDCMSKVAVGLLLAAALVLTPMWAAAAEFKVGVVDGMDVVSKSADGKRVQDSIKRKSEELGKPFAQRRQDLGKEVEEFQKQAAVMKEDARKRRAEELEKKMADFQKQGSDAEKQLQQFQEKELAPLFQKLEGAVKGVAQEDKLDMVLDKRNAGLLYMDPKLDITEKVRSRFGR
jgi:outer membrane protein